MYSNEPHSIQPEGRAVEIACEDRGIEAQHGKGEAVSTCQNCGIQFMPTRGSAGKYCKLACHSEKTKNEKPHWFECSRCLASVGLGAGKTGKLIGKTKSSVGRAWRRLGVNPAKIKFPKTCDWWGCEVAASGWMNEYKPRFPDWSYIWRYELSKKKCREYQSMMYHSSPKHSKFRLKKIARSRIYNAIKRIGKVEKPRIRYRTEKMIGCTVEQFCRHLESKFKRGMTWENHGSAWHIDHIIPMAHFDVKDESQLLTSCHYTNMQPMWASDNWAKSDKLQKDEQMHLLLEHH